MSDMKYVAGEIAFMNCTRCKGDKFYVVFDVKGEGFLVGDPVPITNFRKIISVRCVKCGGDHPYEDGKWTGTLAQ